MASRFELPFADVGNGISPSDGAELFFFEPGTSTPKDTYTNQSAIAANTNPVVANSDGLFSDIWILGSYKVVLKDKDGSQQWETDPVVQGLNADNGVFRFDTVAAMVASTGLDIGSKLETLGYLAKGDGGGNTYEIVAAGTGSNDGGSFINLAIHQAKGLFPGGVINANQFGAAGNGIADDGAAIQAAIDYVDSIRGAAANAEAQLVASKTYLFATGLVIPPRVTLDCNGALLKYSGAGVAVTLGSSDSTLSAFSRLLDFNMHLVNKTSKGVRLRGTKRATVRGYIESLFQPFDNTRTNVGVEIDGVDVSSFFNYINVECNHTHESFRVTTTGTVQPTEQLFINCSALGDQTTDDTSIGWNFVDTAISGMGDGTKFLDCNIENVNTGIYFGQNCRAIDVNARWELTSTATSRLVKFHTATKAISLRGAGIDSALIGAVPGGIEGFANGQSHYVYDTNGNIRMGGNDSSFAGISPPVLAIGQETILLKSDADSAIRTVDQAAGTGSILMQPGAGSSSFGAYMRLNAHTHASRAGDCEIGPSIGAGSFRVTGGLGQADRFEVTATSIDPGVDNTSSCGRAPKRYTEVFATNATINTSDDRYKSDIKPISEEVLDAWEGVEFYQYTMDENDNDKLHFGVTAQQIVNVFQTAGLNAFDYALIQYDEWPDEYKEVDGAEVLVTEGGDRFGVRYSQCMVLEMACMRRKLSLLRN